MNERLSAAPVEALPQAVESEVALLGALLLAPDRFHEAEGLTVADFVRGDHRSVFRAIQTLATTEGTFDLPMVASELANDLEHPGGVLVELTTLVPNNTNIEFHARRVALAARKRRGISGAGRLVDLIQRSDGDLSAVRDAVQLLSANLLDDSIKAEALPLVDLETIPPVAREWLVQDLIPRNGWSLIWGPAGNYKTTTLLRLAYECQAIESEGLFGMNWRNAIRL